jgi:hypothetical protein
MRGREDVGEVVRAFSLPVIVGLLLRAIPVLSSDFPLNDGGLFFAMTRDLQNAQFVLPSVTTYNGLEIPFVYPPLGFYLAGGLSSLSGIALIDVFRFLPLIVATLMIPAVYLLARELLASRFQALLATWAFALLPRAFAWLIAGGGLTRSLGFLFATLALVEGVRLYRRHRRADLVGLAVFAALTIVSHPQAAEFVGLSMVLMLLAFGRTWRALRDSALAAALAGLLTLPWWWIVVSAHGVGPFLSGGQLGLDLISSALFLLTFSFTDEPFLGFLAALALLGLLWQVASRRYLLPGWVLVLFVVDQRGAPTSSMIPMAMLIAVALDEVVLGRLAGIRVTETEGRIWPAAILGDRFGRLVLGIALILGVLAAIAAPARSLSPLHAVPDDNRAAMAWVGANSPRSARFLVLTGSPWFIDADAEWFPVLAERSSVATVQGYEWLGKDRWTSQEIRDNGLQDCSKETTDCLAAWVVANAASDAWVYLPNHPTGNPTSRDDCCTGLRASLTASGAYDVVYQGPGGTVFRPRS